MDSITGESKRYLDIDLSNRSCSVYTPPEEDLRDYIGAKGLGLKIIMDRLGPRLREVDPLGEENCLCFLTGIFIGTGAPCSARFAGVTKSPLTGIMVSSSCGGPFGAALRTAGWDGVIISGKASEPVVLNIDKDGVTYSSAAELWGMETGPAQALVADTPDKGALVIGPAGENGVLYAVIRSGSRYLGRGGLGTVMGAKNLKAIVALGGSFRIEPAEPPRFQQLNSRAKRMITRNSFVKSYRDYGTNYSTLPGITAGYLPIRNFRDRTDERSRSLSGEAMAERYRTVHSVCRPCSVLCGHKGTYPDGRMRHIPEYETTALWGGNILNFDPDLIGVWNERMNELGIDTISCGVTVSWAMEAAERGIRPSRLAFGRPETLDGIFDDIAWKRGEGAELALGSRRLSQRCGGEEFAAQVKGLELAAYDPRAGWGQGLNYAVANRGGCHLNAYPIALEAVFNFIPPYTCRAKAAWVAFFEDLFSAVNSTQTCQFTVFGYLLEPTVARLAPKPLLKFLMARMPSLTILFLDWSMLAKLTSAITGRSISRKAYLMAGRRTHVLERCMNMLCGITAADDTLPRRFLTEAHTAHPVPSTVPSMKLTAQYYRRKGYTPDGRPSPRLLRRLGIRLPKPLEECTDE
jgi:aldehyde:ferredoxin oxidoreductase